MNVTFISYYGEQLSKCGYCKGTDCSQAHGMHAYDNMPPEDYQDLIDRGWRRSGQYCYKPYNKTTCCPCYTIKCDALEFKLSKSHKKILKRMNRFLRDGQSDKTDVPAATEDSGGGSGSVTGSAGINDEPRAPDVPIRNINLADIALANPERQQSTAVTQANALHNNAVDAASSMTDAESKSITTKSSADLRLPCKKAKQIRLERKQAKLAAKGIKLDELKPEKNNASQEKSLSDYINEASATDKHQLRIVLVSSKKQRVSSEVHNLYRKYQMKIHNDSPKRLTPSSLDRFLYRSPLQHTQRANSPIYGYGSFHQLYWLDDKLIAVGVIDILPYCVSAVYFFYDPDYSFLSLGTYGSLREIELVQQLAKTVPALKYYYMGFYIHSNPKMRYKGKLLPSYLLCPETYTWHLLTDEVRKKLDECKYQRLNTDPTARDNDEFLESDLDAVLLLVENTCIKYQQYIQITGDNDDRDLILEYGKLVGKRCAHRMLYVKS